MNDEFKKFQLYLNYLSTEERQQTSEELVSKLLFIAHWASEVMIAAPICCQREGICASCKLRDGLQALRTAMDGVSNGL